MNWKGWTQQYYTTTQQHKQPCFISSQRLCSSPSRRHWPNQNESDFHTVQMEPVARLIWNSILWWESVILAQMAPPGFSNSYFSEVLVFNLFTRRLNDWSSNGKRDAGYCLIPRQKAWSIISTADAAATSGALACSASALTDGRLFLDFCLRVNPFSDTQGTSGIGDFLF